MYGFMSLNDKVIHEYEKIREFHKNELQKATNELYDKLPEARQIDDRISFLAVKYASMVVEGKLTAEEAVLAVENDKKDLLEKKKELIKKAGIVIETPEMFSCKKCNDTGFVNGEKCSCYMDIMKKVMLSEIDGSKGVSFDFDKDNFDNFNLEWYSKSVDSVLGISPYDNMKFVLRDCKLFCMDFKSNGGNLYFYGNSGTGKTFMANCIANHLMRQGYSVMYQSAYKLFQFMEDYKFNRINRENTAKEYDSVYNSDLLIIDDLGTEFTTAYTCSVLFDILNTRMLNGKSTIISTNLSVGNLEEKYTERVSSRIKGNFEMMRFIGEDIRIAKKFSGR